MTLYEFIALDEMEQQEAIWEGIHVADREDEEYRILLYQLDNFYIEVYYHKEDNVIKKYRAFKSTELLDLYADQVDIVKLLNS